MHGFSKQSISRQLTISLVVSIITLSTAIIVFNYYQATAREKNWIEKKADEYINIIRGTLEIPLWDMDRENMRNICFFYFRNDLITKVRLTGAGDEILFFEQDNDEEYAGSIGRSREIVHNGESIGRVELALSSRSFNRINQRHLFLSIVVLVVSVATILAVTGLLLRRFLRRPLDHLSTLAQAYASGVYSSHGPPVSYQEFNPLVSVLTEMGKKIETQMANLRRTEKKYRDIFENATEGIFQTTPDGRFLNVNPAMARIIGYGSPEELTADVTDIGAQLWVHARDRNLFVNQLSATLNGLEGFETEFRCQGGRIAVVSINARVVRGDDGEVLYLEGSMEDITQRKRAEEELKRHRDRLEEIVNERTRDLSLRNEELQKEIQERKKAEKEVGKAQALLLAAIQQSPAGILIADAPDAVIRVANAAALSIRGETSAPLIGIPAEQHAENWQIFHPEGRPFDTRDLSMVRAVFKGETSRDEIAIIKRGDGSERWITINAAPVRNQEGEVVAGVVVFLDITQWIEAQTEKEELEIQLRQSQKMEAIGILASGIAHDFNNILQVIGGYIQLVSCLDGLQPRARHYALEIDRTVKRATELVQRLLTFSRRVDPKLGPVYLNREIHQAQAILERTIPKMIAIKTNLAKDLKPINADADQLNQVIVNLATNARDAMPEGGELLIETRNIYLTPADVRNWLEIKPGEYVLLEISDSGEGIPEEDQKKIFDPFYTTKDVGKGTGLGLSVVYGIVKSHGGHVICSSNPGRGTMFSIYLPALERTSIPSPRSECEEQAIKGGHEKILLVDDEAAIREISSEMLDQYGYRVTTAQSGEEALEIYRKQGNDIDLVILDLGMPGMGGRKAMNAILDIDREAKIIIASGYNADIRSQTDVLTGARAFINKPYRLTDMLGTVREILDKGA